ncbi:DNA polymerase III subunit delta' [Methyloligella sp. 2.7D]|uniref:DNA polymerase III subunit delta' n=1 Tax=unclassified Methyloligella TaxID=2625955 RepID=UPI00157E0DDB|nr:DNA polymerase III subunit delta' [Methyloligella sp. GL2]QKP77447.1 DNA polymerase III subunit delta' [Methyloligella sp. GL2]
MAAAKKSAKADVKTDEPDRLAGFAAPREVAKVFGHEGPAQEFMDALASGRLHHGWLLTGPEGVGKATLAYALARRLLAQNHAERGGDPDDPGAPLFVQIAGKAHPNLLVLTRTYNPKTKRFMQWISVDEVRRLRGFLGATAAESGWRVVIVDRADELNQSAANALLKALEEPPPNTVFLLLANAEGRLPATIRSRCRSLRLSPLEMAPLRQAVEQGLALSDRDASPDALETALSLSEGSVRLALELATGEGIGLYRDILSAFAGLPALDGVWLHSEADRLSSPANVERFELFFALLLGLMERLIRHAATGHGASNDEEAAIAARLLSSSNLKAWAEAWEAITKSKAEVLGLNLDRGLLLVESFGRLQALASKAAA